MATRGGKSGKKAAKTYERPGLSEEEIEEIKEAFNLFDTDGSGKHTSCWDWHALFVWESCFFCMTGWLESIIAHMPRHELFPSAPSSPTL